MDPLVNRPNTVPQRQRIYQSDSRPVFQRLPRSRLYLGVTLALTAVGTFGVVGGLWNAAHGKKSETAV